MLGTGRKGESGWELQQQQQLAHGEPQQQQPGQSQQQYRVSLRPRGLPIGNLTSQFWANVYLHDLDVFVKQELKCPAYLRYMDDIALFSDDKRQLHAWKSDIREFLASRLRLTLHPKKSLVFPTRLGMDFCGFILFDDHRRIRRSSIRRFVRRFKRQREAYRHGELSLEKMSESLRCWAAHASHGDTWRLRSRLFRELPISKSYIPSV